MNIENSLNSLSVILKVHYLKNEMLKDSTIQYLFLSIVALKSTQDLKRRL